MPRKNTAANAVAPRFASADVFNKTKNFDQKVLIDTVFQNAGVQKDAEVVSLVEKVLLPRFAEVSPTKAFRSLTKMVKEIGQAGKSSLTGSGGNSNNSNGSDLGLAGAQASSGEAKRRPGRPKGSKNKPKETNARSGPEASGEKRGPGRPKGSKNKPIAKKAKSDRPR